MKVAGYATENAFCIAEGEEGEIYVFLTAKKNQPQMPKIIYDGRDSPTLHYFIFVKNSEFYICVSYIDNK